MKSLKLYNTRSRQIEDFSPLAQDSSVGLYTCGPTVYDYVHIGNWRAFIFEDILKRVLNKAGYTVKHVMNITDVGHLTSDADTGEDKMEKGARREGKTAWDVARFFTEAFFRDAAKLNIIPADIYPKATEHIPEQIAQIDTLLKKGLAYETADGVYFDTSQDPHYGYLARLKEQDLLSGVRVENSETKRHPTDFALWKFSPDGEKRSMEWSAYDKMGFPGWHIECSAMSMKYLGENFDIHCGGIDHIPVHHTNEIAQAEGVTGHHPWVKYWLHNEFLLVNEEKMSKSLGNAYNIDFLTQAKIRPLAYRFFLLQAHYRKQLNFTLDGVRAAETGLKRLKKSISELSQNGNNTSWREEIFAELANDLNTAAAIGLLSESVKEKKISQEDVGFVDEIFGLDLLSAPEKNQKESDLPEEIVILRNERDEAKKNKNFERADELRRKIESLGFRVEDKKEGTLVVKED